MRAEIQTEPESLMPNATPDMYHAWLIRQRVYCERDSCFRKPTCVMKYNGRDTVLCSEHAGRLEAVRRSDERQESHNEKQP